MAFYFEVSKTDNIIKRIESAFKVQFADGIEEIIESFKKVMWSNGSLSARLSDLIEIRDKKELKFNGLYQ